jgi:hypothetical protein
VSTLDLKLEPKAAAVRRVEVITGGGVAGAEARAIEASLVPGTGVDSALVRLRDSKI